MKRQLKRLHNQWQSGRREKLAKAKVKLAASEALFIYLFAFTFTFAFTPTSTSTSTTTSTFYFYVLPFSFSFELLFSPFELMNEVNQFHFLANDKLTMRNKLPPAQ